MNNNSDVNYVVCIDNKGFEVSLEPRKIYLVIPDDNADNNGMLRIIDESGEDYLFPAEKFSIIVLTPEVANALKLAA